jgi:hypothetical protein
MSDTPKLTSAILTCRNHGFYGIADQAAAELEKLVKDNDQLRANLYEISKIYPYEFWWIQKHDKELKQFRSDNAALRVQVERLLDATEEFLALPPDDMKDFMPFGQPTTASDCRLLTAAHRMASAFLAQYPTKENK